MTRVRQMRIHRFGGKEVLQADEVELSQPDAGEVLIRVQAASINPVDYKIRLGKPRSEGRPSSLCARPRRIRRH
jgi:NADPH:quinone reductase-like Zn-dependent oxidoreductase